MTVHVLVAIVKKRLRIEASLYTLLQILSVTLFEKMSMQRAFSDIDLEPENQQISNQLNLSGF